MDSCFSNNLLRQIKNNEFNFCNNLSNDRRSLQSLRPPILVAEITAPWTTRPHFQKVCCDFLVSLHFHADEKKIEDLARKKSAKNSVDFEAIDKTVLRVEPSSLSWEAKMRFPISKASMTFVLINSGCRVLCWIHNRKSSNWRKTRVKAPCFIQRRRRTNT